MYCFRPVAGANREDCFIQYLGLMCGRYEKELTELRSMRVKKSRERGVGH